MMSIKKTQFKMLERNKKNPRPEFWELRLYVAGTSAKSATAFENIKKICEDHMPGQYSIEIVDLIKNPKLARGDQIIATPTLVRKLPEPIKRILGDLSNTDKTLVGLDLKPKSSK